MKILSTAVFFNDISEWLTEDEQWDLEDFLIQNPSAGDLIPGGKGLRKLRWGQAGQGKRGGLRLIYHWSDGEHIFFVVAYKKTRQANLTPKQLKILTTLLEA